ncbi:MAG: Nramp family divalent metal transporter [bacterium]|nr:Nramp family divalent metal transporter [bacterium]
MKLVVLQSPPSIWKTLGPSFILLGLALGSGELILWPFLAANYGLGLLWGAALGITLQFFLNTEVMRYSLSWSESVFVGFRRLSSLLPIWFIISTAIPWSLPGFSSATAEIIHSLLPQIPQTVLAIAILLLTGIMLTLGTSLYKTMVRTQTLIIIFSLLMIIFLAVQLIGADSWVAAAWGLAGKGAGWWFFPEGVKLSAFLAAFAYAGAGGNLNLAQSYYIREKGLGMGAFADRISGILQKSRPTVIRGTTFPQTKTNIQRWDAWWRFARLEHGIVFWGLGLATIILLSVLSFATVHGQEVSSGLSFLYAQAAAIRSALGAPVATSFLIVAVLMLFSTQLGVLESSGRIIAENVSLLKNWNKNKADQSKGFAVIVWTQIIVGIIVYVSGFSEPRGLITLSAILNAAAMMVSFGLLLVLNTKRLQPLQRPTQFRKFVLIFGAVFFLLLLVTTWVGW